MTLPAYSTRIGIGVSDFGKLRSEGLLFIDKSLFIEEALNAGAEILLIPRPRRFGKTLNLSMLRCFLELRQDLQARQKAAACSRAWQCATARSLPAFARIPGPFFSLPFKGIVKRKTWLWLKGPNGFGLLGKPFLPENWKGLATGALGDSRNQKGNPGIGFGTRFSFPETLGGKKGLPGFNFGVNLGREGIGGFNFSKGNFPFQKRALKPPRIFSLEPKTGI